MPRSPTNFPRNGRIAQGPGFDPQIQPIVPLSHELPRLEPSSLQLEFICAAFLADFEWQVEPLFTQSFQVEHLDIPGTTKAAVFFPLVQREDGLHVILTRRASHLYDHAGQISFPGGRIEADDADAIDAALRETEEEIGVSRRFVELIGCQPSFLTSTRFTMKPVIGLVKPGFTLTPATDEVAEVFEVPLAFLMDPRHHRLHRADLPGGGHRFYFSMPWGTYFIWGATAALIRNFYHYLAAAQSALR